MQNTPSHSVTKKYLQKSVNKNGPGILWKKYRFDSPDCNAVTEYLGNEASKPHLAAVMKGSGVEEASHEISHALNYMSKNPLISLPEKARRKSQGLFDSEKTGTAQYLMKRYLANPAVQVGERSANKTSLNLMKKLGASDDQINQAKKFYKISELAYAAEGRAKIGKSRRTK